MRNNALPPHFLNSQLLNQMQHSMESATGFECSDTLLILTLEVQSENWFRGCLAFEWCSNERFWRLWCRGYSVEGLGCDGGSEMDVWLDKLMRSCD